METYTDGISKEAWETVREKASLEAAKAREISNDWKGISEGEVQEWSKIQAAWELVALDAQKRSKT